MKRTTWNAVAPQWPVLPQALLLAVAALMVYANALDAPFVIDDINAIINNPQIRTLTLSDALSPPKETPVAGRPLVNLTFAINYTLSGLDVRGYRFTNLIIHVLAALTLLGVVRRTLAAEAIPPQLQARASLIAFVSAAMWLLHPLNSEVVNYVSQRTSGLKGVLYLLTLYCSIRALQQHPRRWQAAAAIACVAGMASKESMVTAPVMVVLYDRIFVYASFREAFRRRRSLYLALAAGWLVLAALMVQRPRTTIGFTEGVTAWTYLLNQITVIVDYFRLAFVPRDLVADYGVPRPLTVRGILSPALILASIAGATLVALIRWPRIGFLGAAVFITLAPTSSIVPIVTEVGAERRMYLPLAAIVVLVVCGVFMALDSWRRHATSTRLFARMSAVTGVSLCLLLATRTILRNQEYQTELALAETIVERRPHGRAYLRLADVLIGAGRRPEALVYLQRARATDTAGASFLLGNEYVADGKFDAAEAELLDFLGRHPNNPAAADARLTLARIYVAQGRFNDAAAELTDLLGRQPGHVRAHEDLGDILLGQRQPAAALSHLDAVVAARPQDVNALGKLGTALAALDRYNEAHDLLFRAVVADPQHPHARRMFARVLASQGRLQEAYAQFQRARELAPHDDAVREELEAVAAALR